MDFVQTWSTTTTKYSSIAANSDKSNEYQFSSKTTVYVCQKEILRTESIQLQKRSTNLISVCSDQSLLFFGKACVGRQKIK